MLNENRVINEIHASCKANIIRYFCRVSKNRQRKYAYGA
jgi:hypothetical protein